MKKHLNKTYSHIKWILFREQKGERSSGTLQGDTWQEQIQGGTCLLSITTIKRDLLQTHTKHPKCTDTANVYALPHRIMLILPINFGYVTH